MGTCVEGEWEEVMAAVNQCFLSMQMDCQRIYMTLKVDYRHGRTDGMRSKVSAVTG
jgi:uncharacterized protein YqgV (UPF0045/DUF77 family)